MNLRDAHGDFALQAFFAAQRFADQRKQFGVADDFDERVAFAAGGIDIENLREGTVAENHALLGIDDRGRPPPCCAEWRWSDCVRR